MKSRLAFSNRFDFMKRCLLPGLLAVAMTQLATAQITSTFNNEAGSVYQIFPGSSDPGVIDATNFVNAGVFSVNLPLNALSAGFNYFQTSDTLNYTNTGVMTGNPGFDFEFICLFFLPHAS